MTPAPVPPAALPARQGSKPALECVSAASTVRTNKCAMAQPFRWTPALSFISGIPAGAAVAHEGQLQDEVTRASQWSAESKDNER
jgi:hypothetical protein